LKLLALKDLPNRITSGQVFDERPAVARVLILLGVAEAVPDDTDPKPPARRTYRRRDLKAEE